MWTDQYTSFAVDGWRGGKSAGVIAEELARAGLPVSRNAVIGKLFRLGLLGDKTGTRQRQCLPRRPQTPAQKRARALRNLSERRAMSAQDRANRERADAEALAVLARIAAEPDVKRISSVLDLEDHHCRYPIGDPKLPGFGFCGDRKVSGLSYCAAHAMRTRESTRAIAAAGYYAKALGAQALSVEANLKELFDSVPG